MKKEARSVSSATEKLGKIKAENYPLDLRTKKKSLLILVKQFQRNGREKQD